MHETDDTNIKTQFKMLTVTYYYNLGYTIHDACKLASISLHTYYRLVRGYNRNSTNDTSQIKTINVDET